MPSFNTPSPNRNVSLSANPVSWVGPLGSAPRSWFARCDPWCRRAGWASQDGCCRFLDEGPPKKHASAPIRRCSQTRKTRVHSIEWCPGTCVDYPGRPHRIRRIHPHNTTTAHLASSTTNRKLAKRHDRPKRRPADQVGRPRPIGCRHHPCRCLPGW